MDDTPRAPGQENQHMQEESEEELVEASPPGQRMPAQEAERLLASYYRTRNPGATAEQVQEYLRSQDLPSPFPWQQSQTHQELEAEHTRRRAEDRARTQRLEDRQNNELRRRRVPATREQQPGGGALTGREEAGSHLERMDEIWTADERWEHQWGDRRRMAEGMGHHAVEAEGMRHHAVEAESMRSRRLGLGRAAEAALRARPQRAPLGGPDEQRQGGGAQPGSDAGQEFRRRLELAEADARRRAVRRARERAATERAFRRNRGNEDHDLGR